MPSDAIVTLTAGQLPQGFCFQNPQQYFEAIVAAMSAVLPGAYSTFNFGNSTPAPEDQDKPWIRTDAFGNFDRLYTFNGKWVSPNPRPPSENERMIWKGSYAQLWAYDGGDGVDPSATAPTATTGAMWQADTDFSFRVPVGAGTNPTAYDGVNTTIAVGDTGGEQKHVQDKSELCAHEHVSPFFKQNTGGGLTQHAYDANGTGADLNTSTEGGGKAFNVMQPYRGVIFARRTSRIYFTVP